MAHLQTALIVAADLEVALLRVDRVVDWVLARLIEQLLQRGLRFGNGFALPNTIALTLSLFVNR